MHTLTGLATAFRFGPVTTVAPFTYRDGTTYLELLEKMRAYIVDVLVPAYNGNVNELNEAFGKTEIEIRGVIDDALVEIDRRIMLINNRTGNLEVQHITLTGDTEFTIDPAWPDNHVTYVEVTQDATGGHDLTLPANVTGSIDIDPTPGNSTRFELFPDGNGNWSIVSTDSTLADAFLVGGAFRDLLETSFADKATQETVESGRLSPDTMAGIDNALAGLGNRLTDAETDLTGRLSPAKLTETVQATPVAGNFMPYCSVSYGFRNGYRYEMVHVKMGGKPKPGVLTRGFAPGFLAGAGRGPEFKGGPSTARTVQEIADYYSADVAFNATGWQTATDETQYRLRGVQIHKGEIYADFETSSNRGRHALGVHRDGTVKPYRVEDGWTAQKMVDAGVVDTFCFGPLLVVDGVQQDVESLSWASSLTGGAVSGRTIVGVMANHDIALITVVGVSSLGTGVGGNAIAELAKSRGLHHAILLDGGGSTQAVANGITYHPSSDSAAYRTLTDIGIINARVTQVPDSSISLGAEPLSLISSVVKLNDDVYTPGVIVRGGQVSYMGRLSSASGANFPVGEWIEVGDVPDKARPKIPVGAGVFITTDNGTVQIRAYGRMSIKLNTAAPNITLSGISYPGF